MKRLVILTGAGISAESGIPTFRGSDGLWENHRIEDVATPEAFVRDPVLVNRFYNLRRRALLRPEIQPNAAHLALGKLQQRLGDRVLLVTQNIDDLHERGGSSRVLHMHGELLKVKCTQTGIVYPRTEDIGPEDRCECCGQTGTLRPEVVWFGEMPIGLDRIEQALSRCDEFWSIGTSGRVYPAAGFVRAARHFGAHTVEMNLDASDVHSDFHEVLAGPATRLVPARVERFLAEAS